MKKFTLRHAQRQSSSARFSQLFINAAVLFTLAIVGAASIAGEAFAQTSFYYSSPAGETVGRGKTRTFTSPTDTISVSSSGSNGIYASINEGGLGLNNPEYWSFNLAAPPGQVLSAGVYEGAVSSVAYGSSAPTVNFYGGGGCYYSTRGRLNVLAISYDLNGVLTSFAANFSQWCGENAPAIVAEIRFNSAILLTKNTVGIDTTPDPFELIMQSPVNAGATVTSLATMVYGVNAQTPISIANGEYKINDGPYTSSDSTVSNTDRVTVRTTAPLIAGGTVTPTLTVGAVSASKLVRSYLPGTKLSGLRITSSPGDFIGRGVQRLFLSPLDSVSVSAYNDKSISISVAGRETGTVSVQVAPPSGLDFVVGQYYENSQRFRSDEFSGLDVSADSTGCNRAFGRFIVRELSKTAAGTIDSLAIDFEHHCEQITKPPLFGEVRINSAIPFSSLPTDLKYGVAINKIGSGSGTVTAGNGELTCGSVCTVYLPLGWNLALSAEASAGSVFKGWQDNGCSGVATCNFQVTSGRSVTARFEIPTSLTVVRTGSGAGNVYSTSINGTRINCPDICSADYDLGATVTLEAYPNYGSVFTGWSGGGCTGSATCTTTMSAAKTVQANFVLGFILSITTDQTYGAGKVVSTPAGVDCGATCVAVVSPVGGNYGTVLLTAIPSPGSIFSGWSGDGCSGTSPCSVVMSQARNIKATFIPVPRRVSVLKQGTGDGVVTSTNGSLVCGNTCSVNFSPAVGIELVAIPVQGSTFFGWSGGGCIGSSNCVISQTNDVTVTAIFNRNRSTLGRTTDFNGDGKADILIKSSTGTISQLQLNGSVLSNAANLLSNQPEWTITHVGDFNGDGRADVLWRNTNGSVTLWLMDGATVLSAIGLIGPDANWRVTDVADFNGDGKADILWRNVNGAVTLWLMNGTAITDSAGLLGPDPNWTVSHVGDFNGDGKADLLWRNNNGAVTMWMMNGTSILSAAGILGPDLNWSVSHVADFNGDGKDDLLWRNINGAVTSWLMDGATVTSSAGLLGPGQNWSVTHTADFNGDGQADLLWRNDNGAVTIWLMSGTVVSAAGGLTGPDPNWRVINTADYSGDGKADLFWVNLDGSLRVWVLNGTNITSTGALVGATSSRVVP